MVVIEPPKEPVQAPGGLEDADVWGDAPNVSEACCHPLTPLTKELTENLTMTLNLLSFCAAYERVGRTD